MSEKVRVSSVFVMHYYLIYVFLQCFIALFSYIVHAQPLLIVCFERFIRTSRGLFLLLCGVLVLISSVFVFAMHELILMSFCNALLCCFIRYPLPHPSTILHTPPPADIMQE